MGLLDLTTINNLTSLVQLCVLVVPYFLGAKFGGFNKKDKTTLSQNTTQLATLQQELVNQQKVDEDHLKEMATLREQIRELQEQHLVDARRIEEEENQILEDKILLTTADPIVSRSLADFERNLLELMRSFTEFKTGKKIELSNQKLSSFVDFHNK